MDIQACPVLYPTEQQFSDFYAYIHQLDKNYKATYGMVKIVPPASWKPQSHLYSQKLQNLTVKNPIEQNVQGMAGFYQSKNIVQQKMTLKAYRKYAEQQSQNVLGKTTQEKERLFWKTITYSPPIYGADLTGTLMGEQAGSWNFNKLDSVLSYALNQPVKGVTEPYCYIGCWKAFFSWHKEDLDLAAINYIHQGASKVWYSIAKADAELLDLQARGQFKAQARQCSEFMRHKTFLINPEVLRRKHRDLKISRMEHKAGEIMMVFGGAYHSGFNCGFNIAEAVNYATLEWLKELTTVRFCKCFRKSVKGEIESILYNLEQSTLYETLEKSEDFKALQNYVFNQQLNQEAQKGGLEPTIEKEQPIFEERDRSQVEVHEQLRQQLILEVDQSLKQKTDSKAKSSLKIKKTKKEQNKRNKRRCKDEQWYCPNSKIVKRVKELQHMDKEQQIQNMKDLPNLSTLNCVREEGVQCQLFSGSSLIVDV